MQNDLPDWLSDAQRDQMEIVGHFWITMEELNQALVAAERRGIGRAAEKANDLYEDWRTKDSHAGLSARVIRDAIRKLGDKI